MSFQQVYDNTCNGVYSLNHEGEAAFKADLTAAIMGDFNFNEPQAQAIYKYAYEEGYSAGYYEIVGWAQDAADLAADVMRLA